MCVAKTIVIKRVNGRVYTKSWMCRHREQYPIIMNSGLFSVICTHLIHNVIEKCGHNIRRTFKIALIAFNNYYFHLIPRTLDSWTVKLCRAHCTPILFHNISTAFSRHILFVVSTITTPCVCVCLFVFFIYFSDSRIFLVRKNVPIIGVDDVGKPVFFFF